MEFSGVLWTDWSLSSLSLIESLSSIILQLFNFKPEQINNET